MKKKILAIVFAATLAATPALAFFLNTAGPNFPTAATGTTNTIGGGTASWLNPTNIEANDGANANSNLTGTTADLIGTGFAFAVNSTDTVNGILLEIRYSQQAAAGATESHVNLLKAGAVAGANKSTAAALPTTPTTVSYGGSTDLWLTTWTPSDINNPNFGAVFVAARTGSGTIFVDFFRITITSTSAPPPGSQFLQMFGIKLDPPKPHSQTRFIAASVSGPNTRRETQP
ncbi:MAG TPA: hypothetical protein VHA06_23420 [Candidatus Angelobacter sp.]|nr:hypothetical protein [Candidatus Angelobacter sp.]